MKRDFEGKEELPSNFILFYLIFFKFKRWQKAAGAPLCQECFWQIFIPHTRLSSGFGRGKKILVFIFLIFLDKPASNLQRDPDTGELGEDFPSLFVLFYPFAVGVLAVFF